MNIDTLMQVLLHCDIDTIKNYHLTSKNTILNDYFWRCKFAHDQLPILNGANRIEYQKVYKTVLKVNRAMTMTNISLPLHHTNLLPVPLQIYAINDISCRQSLYIQFKDQTITYKKWFYVSQVLQKHTISIDLDDLYLFMIKIFYS